MVIPPIELHRNEGARFCGRVPHFRADAEGGESVSGGVVAPDRSGVTLLKTGIQAIAKRTAD
jgi:hypothetical protein